MKTLRDKKLLTRFLILYYCSINRPTRLAEIAQEFDMTEQGVSNYISDMEEEELIDTAGKNYRPTSKGMEFVRDILGELGDFLDEASSELEFISTCIAIADEEIKEGEEVGLFMKDGFLHASKDQSTSKGVALIDSNSGAPIEIGGLKGITSMEVGKIYIVLTELASNPKKDAEKLKQKLMKIDYDLLSVMGETQYGLMNLIRSRIDIMFAPITASIDASEKGLDVAILASEKDVEKVIDKLRNRNKKMDEEYKIEYKIV